MKELIAALAKAKLKFLPILADSSAKIETKTGRKIEFKYPKLATIVNAVTPALSDNGLVVVHVMDKTEFGFAVITRLLHESGDESYPSYFPVKMGEDPKAIAAQISYGRRYNLCQLLDLAIEDEDDAPPEAHANYISEEQRRRLHAIRNECGVSVETLKDIVAKVQRLPLDQASTKTLLKVDYETVVDAVQALKDENRETKLQQYLEDPEEDVFRD